MKKLMSLIESNNSENILNYLNGDFKNRLPLYINILDRVPDMQKEINKLKLESQTRSDSIDELSKFLSGGELDV